jgi:acetyl esterase/lipase
MNQQPLVFKVISHRPFFFVLSAAILVALVPSLTRGEGTVSASKPAPEFEVQIVPDIPYYEGKDADPVKHQLDLYLPRGQKDFPVLFFIHGGGWRHGDKSFYGLYSALAKRFAQHGVGTVVINYRLSPTVVHPAHIHDVARAFAWTYRNIARYGGRPDQLFISGHSAGGHLAALLATDEVYLKAVGLTVQAIRGIIPISGVYDLTAGNRVFAATFGTDAKTRQEAAPLAHIHPGVPPSLIIYADADLPVCGKRPSEEFCRCLQGEKCDARTLEVKDRNHITILLSAVSDGDPVARAILDFIAAHR